MSTSIFQNGSQWLRADFHLHTQSDKEFLPYEGGDVSFVEAYSQQLFEQQVGIGVITNHNKFNKEEFSALKKTALSRGIGLFAGVEYSTREGIHILIVFDESWYKGDKNHIEEFLNHAFYNKKNYDIPPYPNSALTLQETIQELDQKEKPYFILLAHVNDENGLFEEFNIGTNEFNTWIEGPEFERVIGVQKCRRASQYEALCKAIGRKLAYVEGSDNAQAGIAGIGISEWKTFLKVGEFSFEALYFALTDVEDRLRAKEKPEIKNSYIKSISFEGGLFDGKTIDLSPELNTLIGIRGSGKSSVIEVLRYVLNIPLGLQAMDNDYKNNLVKMVMGSGGKATIRLLDSRGEAYTVEKIYGQKEDIYRNGVLLHDITVDAILKSPIYFGQKDLSNKDVDFEADLIKKLIGNKLSDIKEGIRIKKEKIHSVITELLKIRDLTGLKLEIDQQIKNDEFKLSQYREMGIETKLKKQTQFDHDEAVLREYSDLIRKYSQALESFLSANNEWMDRAIHGSEENASLFIQANSILKEVSEQHLLLKSVAQSVAGCKDRFSLNIDSLLFKKEGLKEEFARIKREINVPSLNPDDFININRRLETSKLKLKAIEKEESRKSQFEELLLVELTELDNLWYKEFVTLQKEIVKINEAERRLQVKLEYKGRKDKFLNYLKVYFKGSAIRESNFETISREYADFIQIFKDQEKLRTFLNENQYIAFKTVLWGKASDILTMQIENVLTIEYDGKPLKDHSLGQRASALILFLLAQKDNDILIIDQPEDDLDNQTIYENVIKEIKKLKGDMQFVFATHNANIPVLGDCEQIVACKYEDGKRINIFSGTIDTPLLQSEIVNIMEGGREALRMRRQIYNIWKIK